LIEQLVGDALETNLMPILKANIEGDSGSMDEAGGGGSEGGTGGMGGEPPIPGARKAPDGEWYILDPTRRTRYLRIGPLAQERSPPGTATTGR
jgi:hypothetical protein